MTVTVVVVLEGHSPPIHSLFLLCQKLPVLVSFDCTDSGAVPQRRSNPIPELVVHWLRVLAEINMWTSSGLWQQTNARVRLSLGWQLCALLGHHEFWMMMLRFHACFEKVHYVFSWCIKYKWVSEGRQSEKKVIRGRPSNGSQAVRVNWILNKRNNRSTTTMSIVVCTWRTMFWLLSSKNSIYKNQISSPNCKN